MSFQPILTAPVQIQVHLVFAVIALCTGPFALYRKRRDRVHKITGYAWVTAMVGLAVTGLFIHSNFPIVGRFGPIHLFSFLTFWGCYHGVMEARRGNIRGHQATMENIWYSAIGVTGLLNLMPGRTLNRALFGEPSLWGLALVALGLLGLVFLWLRTSRPRSWRIVGARRMS